MSKPESLAEMQNLLLRRGFTFKVWEINGMTHVEVKNFHDEYPLIEGVGISLFHAFQQVHLGLGSEILTSE